MRLDAAINAICIAYTLSFPGRETEKLADQDFRISALLIVLGKAKLKCPFATYEYIERYLWSMTDFGEDQFNRVTLHSCITFLMDLDSSQLDMSEEEF